MIRKALTLARRDRITVRSVSLVLILFVLILLTPVISRAFRSVGIALEVIPGGGTRPLSFFTPEPRRSVVALNFEDREILADVYDPGGFGRRPGLILLNGVVREGRRYGELVKLAEALSRAGFVVLVPDLLSYPVLRIVPEDVDVLVRAYEFLEAHARVDAENVGYVGFSVGGSLAFAAAADPRVLDRVKFVAMVGPYSDLRRVVMQVTTTSYFREGETVRFRPESFVWTVTRDTLINTLDRAEDRAILNALFPGPRPSRDRMAMQRFDRSDLSEDGRRIHDVFLNRNPERVDELMDSLPGKVKVQLDRLSPSTVSDRIRAQVLILHENGDPFFPSWESVALVASVPSGEAELTLTNVLQHAVLRTPAPTPGNIVGFYVPEGWKLGSFIFAILSVGNA